MIQAISNKITKIIFLNSKEIESFEVHKYGIEILLSTLIDFSIIIIIGIAYFEFLASIMYLFVFGFTRKFCGGYHCNRYYKCISLHIGIFCLYIFIKNLINNNLIMLLMFVFSCITLYYLSPINVRCVDKPTYSKYKNITRCLLIIYFFVGLLINSYRAILVYTLFAISILVYPCIQTR